MIHSCEFPVLGGTIEKDKPFENRILSAPSNPQGEVHSMVALGRKSDVLRRTRSDVINSEATKTNRIGWVAVGSTTISGVLWFGYIFGNVATASTAIVVTTWAIPFVAAISIGWYIKNKRGLNTLKNR